MSLVRCNTVGSNLCKAALHILRLGRLGIFWTTFKIFIVDIVNPFLHVIAPGVLDSTESVLARCSALHSNFGFQYIDR